jgi:hypothetical protein
LSVKKCTKCGEEWPASGRFFWRNRSQCRACSATTDRGKELALRDMRRPEDMRCCTKCGELWPATVQFFHGKQQHKSGLYPQCRICRARGWLGVEMAFMEMLGIELPKRCTRCWHTKPAQDFALRSNSAQGLRASWCKACFINNSCGWYKNNKVRYLSKYGLTEDGYQQLLEVQGGCCAICSSPDADSRGRALHVDHDHNTGKVRGLLCKNCNQALGLLADDSARLRKAASYLDTFT